jgi:multicomponent Na+:H+ antiporter subunit F
VMCVLGAEMVIDHHTRTLPVLLIVAAVGVFGSISIARFVARRDGEAAPRSREAASREGDRS